MTTTLELKVENLLHIVAVQAGRIVKLDNRVAKLETLMEMHRSSHNWYGNDQNYEPEPPLEREEGEDG